MAGSLLADISRLGPDNDFVDVLVIAKGGGHQRNANSFILAARSEVFHRMLTSAMQEGVLRDGKHTIHLENIAPDTLDALLRWCYCDTLASALDIANVAELFVAADYLQISGLLTCCVQQLGKLLTFETLPIALCIAKATGCLELQQRLGVFLSKSPCFDIQSVPDTLLKVVQKERILELQRLIKRLGETLNQVPAARPAIVFWRQSMTLEEKRVIVAQAMEESNQDSILPALFSGLRDGCTDVFRRLVQARWDALSDESRRQFTESAVVDEVLCAERRGRLCTQIQEAKAERDTIESAVR